ncbi:MAG: hypothetical protein EU532_11745 [Promethearchaeota archaeon]|nr:MAG: hypothetical protein EU532_11745 [Candidatus Lokiarchaeota archaeon]
MNEIKDRNSPKVCTWKDPKGCKECSLQYNLKCKFHEKYLLSFLISFLIFAIPAILGLIISGYGWFILGWIGFMLFFFNFWESRILCRHCPFYAEDGNILHCIANYGSYKLWKYNPKPMNKLEKFQLILGFMILGGYPLCFMLLNQQCLILFISILGLISFFTILLLKTCSRCINFSCPFNRVPKNIVDAYLKKNPIMKDAWLEQGYKID